jgi:hypothetical protein
MSRSKKRVAVIGSVVAVTGLVIGGVAFAAFNRTASATASGAGTENFAPLTVTGTWQGRNVNGAQLVLTNPGSNTVQGKVVSITPASLADDCYGNIVLAAYAPGDNLVVPRGAHTPVILKNAVTLKADATETCEGKRFAPTYTVQFQATRAGVQTPAEIAPAPATP